MTWAFARAARAFALIVVTAFIHLASAAQPAPASAVGAVGAIEKAAAPTDYDPTRAVTGLSVAEIARRHGRPSFLWEVRSPTSTVYLFGTIHVGKQDFYPLPPQVEAAIKASRSIALEADISDDSSAAEVAKLIAIDYRDPLQRRIGADLQARVRRQLERLKIPVAGLQPMKPYILAGFLSVAELSRQGYETSAGVEGYLLSRAKALGKPVIELESQVAQIKLMDGMPFSLQETFLANILTSLESGKLLAQVGALVAAWRDGDVTGLQSAVSEMARASRLSKELDEVMLYSRHPAMLKKIRSMLESGTTSFVAVGSLHLVGDQGLVTLLREQGYQVQQL